MLHNFLDYRQGVALAGFQHSTAGPADRHLVPAPCHRHRWVHADKAVAAQLLALFHRFEQEAGSAPVRAAQPAQFEIDRDRRLQVRRQFTIDCNCVALHGKLAHFVESGPVCVRHSVSPSATIKISSSLPCSGRGYCFPAVPPNLDQPPPTKKSLAWDAGMKRPVSLYENGSGAPILSVQVTVTSPGRATGTFVCVFTLPTPRPIRHLRRCPLSTNRRLSVARFDGYSSGSQSFVFSWVYCARKGVACQVAKWGCKITIRRLPTLNFSMRR